MPTYMIVCRETGDITKLENADIINVDDLTDDDKEMIELWGGINHTDPMTALTDLLQSCDVCGKLGQTRPHGWSEPTTRFLVCAPCGGFQPDWVNGTP